MDVQMHYCVLSPDIAPSVGLEPDGWWGLLAVEHGPTRERSTWATTDPERLRATFNHGGPLVDLEPFELIRPGWLEDWSLTGAQCWDDL